MLFSRFSRKDGLRSEFQQFPVYDSGPAFEVSHVVAIRQYRFRKLLIQSLKWLFQILLR